MTADLSHGEARLTTDDPDYWLDHFNGDGNLAAFVVGGMTKRKCLWCERELRPCNMRRHIAARHFRQLTIYDVLDVGPGASVAKSHEADHRVGPHVEGDPGTGWA